MNSCSLSDLLAPYGDSFVYIEDNEKIVLEAFICATISFECLSLLSTREIHFNYLENVQRKSHPPAQ